MKPILLKIILTINTVYAFDTLRGAGSSSKVVQEEQSYLDKAKYWYKSLIGKAQDKPTNMQSDDVIIINSDRSITFNGKTVKLGAHINEWIKVLGDNYRAGRYRTGYNWDNLGLSISIKSDKGDDKEAQITNSFNIQLITFLEMFPRYKSETYKDFDFNKENGGVSQFYFKGLIRIEDGYLSRETSYDEFRKSDISKTFRNTFSRPSTYKRGFLDENKFSYKRIYIDLTPKRLIKRISISSSLTKEELENLKVKK